MQFFSTTFTLKCKDPVNYSTCDPYEITLPKGRYIFDCVGASGGKTSKARGGYGAHVKGIARITTPTTFYVYVGSKGEDADFEMDVPKNGGYNGGGQGGISAAYEGKNTQTGAGGGGSTDIRLIDGPWYDEESLHSRIIVASAGGGACHDNNGGSGGSFVGDASEVKSTGSYSFGGNQTAEHFGFGANGKSKIVSIAFGSEGNGGCGSGWYGGSAYQGEGQGCNSAGSGGSSYASGYKGMITNEHFRFSSVVMIPGKETKHEGDGWVTITEILPCSCKLTKKFWILCIIVSNLMS